MKLKKIFNETVEEINKMRDKLTSPDDITNAFFDNLMKSWGMDFTDINETETDEEDIETDNTEVIAEMNFNGTFMKHWNIWINELKEQKYCKHIVLEKGQYLQDVL